jgi:CRP/FNR family cyclic AMP-dependent transcriptional regulator
MVTGNEISRPELLAFLRRYPETALALTMMEGDRLRMANRRRMDISGYGTKGRIARLLNELQQAHGRHGPRGCEIDVGLSHREVAELVGASEVSVQRALRTLRMAGLIEIAYRRITIIDADGLTDVARHG